MVGYNFACNKLGMNCAFEIHGAVSKEEVMQEAGDHARYAHQITSVPPDLAARIGNAITT